MRILVVEDNEGIAAGLRSNLMQRGYAVDVCATVAQAWGALTAERFDAVLLDLGLPDGDGSEVVRRLRAQIARPGLSPLSQLKPLPDPSTPVLILTARDQVQDRVAGLNLGADDYLVKPFDMDELEARLRAMMRRAAGQASPVIRYADLEVDPAAHIIRKAGQKVEISPREFAVLWALLLARGRVLSRPQIEEHLYSWGDQVESNAVEVYVHHLRKKLGQKIIVTMRGVGYFMPQEQE
ncbi:response regulator transcription factor [Comamonas sp. Y33R10-2]|uniref:response regulator transcription factor n=1 Tax=Comamonas sp. Y33R10-2 TaxID=2853257 RepID=UPI001C5C95A4|nr:response regulator transcription factor [Comamonas sp. Y33R10-2]QXZ11386.1 response regulator transcription factor [Comamonas sp. Y33R10-2]